MPLPLTLMRSHVLSLALVLGPLLSACSSQAAPPPSASTLTSSSPCENWGYNEDLERVCETRTITLAARDLILDATVNGGVKVVGWDRDDIEVVAIIRAAAPTGAEAQRLVDATRIETRGTVRAVHPDGHDQWGRNDASVSTSFEVRVPRQTDLDLTALNGGVSVEDVEGTIEATTVNGGISLRGVAGDVRARTTNGGIAVVLAGDSWDGTGLDVETTNGGVTLSLPRGYSADLVASTQMGRIAADGLTTTNARHQRGDHYGESVEGRIGRGGAPIRAVTVNGGVAIRRFR